MTYERFWRNKWLTLDATSFDDMIQRFLDAVEELRAMKEQGVTIDASEAGEDYITLTTTNPQIAKAFGFYGIDVENLKDVEDDGTKVAEQS
jgi:hypothetical protein